jgi:hypothetical protein
MSLEQPAADRCALPFCFANFELSGHCEEMPGLTMPGKSDDPLSLQFGNVSS